MSSGRAQKLVLHFDVNETIMVGDPVAGLSFAESLNNIIAKAAYVSRTGTTWHDGSPLNLLQRPAGSQCPPLITDFAVPNDYRRCFEQFRRDASWPSSRFTEEGAPGAVYRPLYQELLKKLQWNHGESQVFAPHGYHFLLPAFFRTLVELSRQGRDFSVVIRTFGTDLPEVAKCLEAFAAGQHPEFQSTEETRDALCKFSLSQADARWALRRNKRSIVHSGIIAERHLEHLGKEGYGSDLSAAESPEVLEQLPMEAQIPQMIALRPVLGIRDDYHFWRGHGYSPQGGKPLWLSLDDGVHHIFFDDNIHNNSDDSIVAIRARRTAEEDFRSLSGAVTRQLEGVLLVKAQPVEAIQDENYFLHQIARCEASFEKLGEGLHDLIGSGLSR
eukprot:CAMPEP_0197626722 /NCGR_PEP_ID=MMETSP1338-20131121/5556_1 /TAXON_ID=43686 ORGANISM="Pelagodinium beii, Strain RCC1491" /NCGR_SAMPLE_ID=MMETSP1338 /ASSEMBLY_ACC=CAM_ASM_000754 /LENGTH=386 /DNA_ID=CAMNT_0043197277 /DNA_START=50 /DNA_END=1210 /DNA_ORIENTATION=-